MNVTAKSITTLVTIFGAVDGDASVARVFSKSTDTLSKISSTMYVKKIPIGKSLNKFIGKYEKFMNKSLLDVGDNSLSMGAAIDVGFDVLEGGLEIAETCNVYGKIKANTEAFEAYIDLLDYICTSSAQKYTKSAAEDLEKIVLDKSWSEYYKQLSLQVGKQVGVTALKVALSIGAELCPYVAVAKAVIEITKALINVTGLANSAKAAVQTELFEQIASGCGVILNRMIIISGAYYSFDSTDEAAVQKYLVQLVQSRIVGENYIKERIQKHDLAAWTSRLIAGTNNEEIESWFETIISGLYNTASYLELPLSENLPYYYQYAKTA